ncbi:MAG: universal stress protein [Bacteroidia bacterium]
MAKSFSNSRIQMILVPVDYSVVSMNALTYAVKLAEHLKAGITLLHIYSIPLPDPDSPITVIAEQMEMRSEFQIEKLRQALEKQTMGKVPVTAISRMGFIIREEICAEIKRSHADLVVMGITGAGKRTNILMGSNTTSLLKKTKCPVLIVPEKARFRPIRVIAFACDEEKFLPGKFTRVLGPLVHVFKSSLLVLNIQKSEAGYEAGKAEAVPFKTRGELASFHPSYYFSVSGQMEPELQLFIKKNKANLLVMVPHVRNLLSNLFHKSNTRSMAFHTHIPLLSIHE